MSAGINFERLLYGGRNHAEDVRGSVARHCHVRWISRGEDQAHDSGVRGGQAGGCAMRLWYGSWPPIGVTWAYLGMKQ